MTRDQLRTGAALVRCLLAGDDSARGPLSDWLDENGLPWGRTDMFSTSSPDWSIYGWVMTAEVVDRLRRADWFEQGHATPAVTVVHAFGSVRIGTCSQAFKLGTWPADIWEESAPCTP